MSERPHDTPAVADALKDAGVDREALLKILMEGNSFKDDERVAILRRLNAAEKTLAKNTAPVRPAPAFVQPYAPPGGYPPPYAEYPPAYGHAMMPVSAPPMAWGAPGGYGYGAPAYDPRVHGYPRPDDAMTHICSPCYTIAGALRGAWHLILFCISWAFVFFIVYSAWKLWSRL